MATLNISFESLASVSNNVLSKGESFSTLLSQIKGYNSQLQEAWAGTDASAYSENVTRQAEQMQKLVETINEIGLFLNKVNQEYQKAQEANKSAISG